MVVKQPVNQALQVAEFLGLERSVLHSASLGARAGMRGDS